MDADLKNRLTGLFLSGFSSSPRDIDQREIEIIIASDCQCFSCGVDIFEMDDFPIFIDGQMYCEQCELDKFYSTCSICENYYETPAPKEEIIIISKESIEEYGMKIKPGFYKVLKYPYFYGDIVSGFSGLFDNTLELIKEVNINSMIYKLHPGRVKKKISAGDCCHDCMMKYTAQTKQTKRQ